MRGSCGFWREELKEPKKKGKMVSLVKAMNDR
jgi:hypothetical protein